MGHTNKTAISKNLNTKLKFMYPRVVNVIKLIFTFNSLKMYRYILPSLFLVGLFKPNPKDLLNRLNYKSNIKPKSFLS